MAKKSNPDFLNGVPELVILQILNAKPMYGYELVQAIRIRSGEKLQFGEGCVYPLLHRLEADGLLTSRSTEVNGRDRIVYRLSRSGKARLSASRKQWEEIANAVTAVFQGECHAQG